MFRCGQAGACWRLAAVQCVDHGNMSLPGRHHSPCPDHFMFLEPAPTHLMSDTLLTVRFSPVYICNKDAFSRLKCFRLYIFIILSVTQNRWLNWLLAWILNLAPLVITITWKTQKLIIDHLEVAIVNNVYEIYVTLKIIVVVLHNRDRYLYYRYTVWDPKISLMHRRILYFNDLSTIIINISLR